jgi:hypothetical protein
MEDNKAPVILILASFVIVMAGMKAASSLLVWGYPWLGACRRNPLELTLVSALE